MVRFVIIGSNKMNMLLL